MISAASAMPVSRQFAAQILFEEATYRIAENGALSYQHQLIYRIDSQAGAEGWSEISAQWDPWYEKPAQLRARVLQPDGSFIELDQKTLTDAPIKADDTETYSSGHVRRAPLPGLSVGSIVEELETIDDKLPYFNGGSLYSFSFLRNVPVGRERVTVELPSSLPFRDAIHDLPGLAVDRSDSNGIRRVLYEATALPAQRDSDIDLATNTPHLPLVEFATGDSWAKVASAYASLSDPQTVVEEARSALPASLPPDRLSRIRAIVQQLHAKVRYTGVEFGDAQLTPQRPSAVLGRHYGDCKDKANLLVAMLRATDIPAHLALLATGPGRQLNPNLPGMNRFDHAIVYVPADGPNHPLWIDATAEYSELGTLPFADQDRYALVIAPETTSLIKTPEPTPGDSTLVETRTFRLSEFGPASVLEESQTHGYIDATYRSNYGGPDTPKVHDDLEAYAKRAYLAKSLTTIKHGEGADLTKPFFLTLEADGARRGFSSLTEAVVAIFPNGTLTGLPKWFSTTPPALAPDASADAKQEDALAKQSRAATYTFAPFRYEQRSKILIPAGFTLRSLPGGKTTRLGPATLAESYTQQADSVLVDFTFDSGPATLSADQALSLRDAVLDLNKREYVGIYFDQVGAKALNAGHIREALEADRALIAQQPHDALHHVRLAGALLQAGIGDAAQSEARLATQLDPKSSRAFQTLGWTLEHNDLGEQFGKGFDLPGATAAYDKAIHLDPDNNDARMLLAILCEFNAHGTRYAPDADLPRAISTYRELIDRTKDADAGSTDQYRDNLLYALLFSRQFGELDKLLQTLPSTPAHTAVAITAAAAQHGTEAGIARAQFGNIPASERNQDLRAAGLQLARLHLYGAAADLMSAGMTGGDDAAAVARQVELYRGLGTASLTPLPATNPAAPVQQMTVGVMSGTLTRDQMATFLAHEGYSATAAWEHDIDKTLASSGFMREAAERSNLPESVLVDLLAGNLKFSSKGNDNDGYGVLMMTLGSEGEHAYITREDNMYRMLADDHDDASIGRAVLLALSKGNTTRAKAMLDWKRDLTHRAGGDDPLSGPLLPRFWSVGSVKQGSNSPEAMRLAAFALLTGSTAIKTYIPEIAAARDKATGSRQTDLDLLLAHAPIGAEEPTAALAAAKRLLEQEPDSITALQLATQAYMFQKDPASLHALLAPHLASHPTDRDLLRLDARGYELAHDFRGAQAAMQKVLDTGKAESADYNGFAWLGLLDGQGSEEAIKAAQQSNMLSKNASFGDLHTLACLYAAKGRTTEAREVLKQAMYASNQTEPNSEVWYTLGLIYEQYGETAAALNAFQHVKAHEDDHTYIDPLSTYLLAQSRINALNEIKPQS